MATLSDTVQRLQREGGTAFQVQATQTMVDFPLDSLLDELVNLMSTRNRAWVRYSFKNRGIDVLLTMSTRVGDTQEVVFISAPTPSGCVAILLAQEAQETTNWRPDKYV